MTEPGQYNTDADTDGEIDEVYSNVNKTQNNPLNPVKGLINNQVGEQSGNHQHMDRDDEPEESETGQNTIITQREIEPEKSKEPPDIMNPEGANPSTTQNIIDNIASLRREAIAGFIPIFESCFMNHVPC